MKSVLRLLLCFVMALSTTTSFAASQSVRDIEVTSKTTISGTVNGGRIKVDVLSKFNTGRGGSSSCDFTELPTGFNPATLGTHA